MRFPAAHNPLATVPLVGTLLSTLTLLPSAVKADMRLVRMAGQETGPWVKFANGHVQQGAVWVDSFEVLVAGKYPSDASEPYARPFMMKSDKGWDIAECTIEGPGRAGVFTSFQVGHKPADILTAFGMPSHLAIGMCGCYAGHCIKCTSKRTGQALFCADSVQGDVKKACIRQTVGWSKHRAGKETWPGW